MLEEHRRAARWPRALEIFGQLLDGLATNKFKPGLYGRGDIARSLDEALLDQLTGWPPQAVTAFKASFGAVAQQQLSRAKTRREIWRVTRYFNTEAAGDALQRLAAQALEAGDAAEALRALQLAGLHPDQPIGENQRLTQRLLIWRMLGREDRTRELLARASTTHVVLGGKRLSLAQAMRQFSLREVRRAEQTRWPALGGRTDRTGIAGLGPLPGAARWTVGLGPAAVPEGSSGPACSDGQRIYIAGSAGLVALDAASGKLIWQYPELARPRPTRTDSRPWSCRLSGDALYTVLAEGLFCFEAATGKLRWKISTAALKDQDFFGRVRTLSSPSVDGDRIWVLATRFAGDVETHLLAFDRRGPRISESAGLLSRSLLSTSPSPRFLAFSYPTVTTSIDGSRMALQTGHGAVLLLDRETGAPLWGMRYKRYPQRRLDQLLRGAGLRPPGPIGVLRSVLFLAPPDSPYCLAIDTIGRRQLWRHPLTPGERLLASTPDAILVGGGTRCRALSPHDGRVLWSCDLGAPIVGLLPGRAALAISTRRELLRVDAKSGKILDRANAPFAGRLIPCGDRLVLIGQRRAALIADRTRKPARPTPAPTLVERSRLAVASGKANDALLAELLRAGKRPIDPGFGVKYPAAELASLLVSDPGRVPALLGGAASAPSRPRTVWKSAYPTSLRSAKTRFAPLLGAHDSPVRHPLGISDRSRVQFRDGYSGALLWRAKTRARPLGIASVGQRGILVFEGLALAFELSTGAPAWAYIPGVGHRAGAEAATPSVQHWFSSRLVQHAALSPSLLLLATDKQLIALDPSSGEPRWRQVHGALRIQRLVLLDRALLTVDQGGRIALRSLKTGALLHSLPSPARSQRLIAATRRGKIALLGYRGSGQQTWVAIDPLRKKPRWRLIVSGDATSVPGSQRYLVLRETSRVSVYGIDDGKLRWRSRPLGLPRNRALVCAISGQDLLQAWLIRAQLHVQRSALHSGKLLWHLTRSSTRAPRTILPVGRRVLVFGKAPFAFFFEADGQTRKLRQRSLRHHHDAIHQVLRSGPTTVFLTDSGAVGRSRRLPRYARRDLFHFWPARHHRLGAMSVARNLAELEGHGAATDALARAFDVLRDDTQPIQLRFIDAAQGHQELAYEGRKERLVLRARRMARPPQIDGVLDEPYDRQHSLRMDGLANLRLIVDPDRPWQPWRGLEDLSARVFTGWDKQYFYLAMVVRDDRGTLFGEEDTRWVGDAAIFSFDSADSGGYQYNRAKDYLFWVFHPRPRKKKKARRPKPKTSGVPGVKSSIRWSRNGLIRTYELAIPWKLMPRMRPRSGRRFGFNILLLDDDSGLGVTRAMSLAPGNLLDPLKSNFVSRRFHPQRFASVELID